VFPKLTGEFVGTLWLVLGGCGSAVLAGAFPTFGIGFLGVSLEGTPGRASAKVEKPRPKFTCTK
jgi:hypothetical protein